LRTTPLPHADGGFLVVGSPVVFSQCCQMALRSLRASLEEWPPRKEASLRLDGVGYPSQPTGSLKSSHFHDFGGMERGPNMAEITSIHVSVRHGQRMNVP